MELVYYKFTVVRSMSEVIMKSLGVKKVKDQLSTYLRDVKNGCIVLITDRGEVVAEIGKPLTHNTVVDYNSLEQDLVEQGILILNRKSKQKVPQSPVTLKEGTALYILSEDRQE